MIIITHNISADAEQTNFAKSLGQLCADAGAHVRFLPHLYHLPEDSVYWEQLRSIPSDFMLAGWLHPRPMEWLLRQHGVTRCRTLVNMQAYSTPSACFEALEAAIERGEAEERAIPECDASLAPRWYPVIDASRCVHCRRCLQFCLFGVYALDADGKVQVTRPDACKPGCPACSRVCPHGAIMFPLYAKDPAIAGAPGCFMSPDEAAQRMYYQRTKLTCPRCGRTPDLPEGRVNDPICEECGRPIPAQASAADPALDDLELLIDQLTLNARKRE